MSDTDDDLSGSEGDDEAPLSQFPSILKKPISKIRLRDPKDDTEAHHREMTKVLLRKHMTDELRLKTKVTFEGSVPDDDTRITNIDKISWADKRTLQLLRHLSTHVLDYANRKGLGAVEIQAAWVASLGRVFVTANVGTAIKNFATSKVDNVSFFFKQVSAFRKEGGKDMEDRDVDRQNRKVQGLKAGKRVFKEDGFTDVAQAMLLAGGIEFVPAGAAQTGKAPIVFLTHDHTKGGGGVRHAEQIIIEHLRALKVDGVTHISGTKIPCFTCYAEHQWSQMFVKKVYVDMCGAMFKNTLNKNVTDPRLLARIKAQMATQTVNLISEVMSDSDYDGDLYE